MNKDFTRFAFLLAFGLGLSNFSTAQITNGGNPRFGVKVGLSGTFLHTNDEDVSDRKGKLGVTAGIFAKLPLTHAISIQPELLYSTKGDEYRYGNDERALRLNMNYLELPAGLHVDILEVVNVHGGGFVGYLLNSKSKRVGGDGEVAGEIVLNADDFSRFDYGWFLGAGVNVGSNLGINFRFTQGLNSIYKSDIQNLLGDVKNVSGTLALSFAF